MQYIKKSNEPPADWRKWFTVANQKLVYDYEQAQNNGANLTAVREYLINEQNGLCAFTQQTINLNNSTIDHIIPKSLNKELSTNYYNLVAVIKNISFNNENLNPNQAKDNKIIPPILFVDHAEVRSSKNHYYFRASASTGEILIKSPMKNKLDELNAKVFLENTSLNHSILKGLRLNALDGILAASFGNQNKSKFISCQFDSILKNKNKPFRQYLLMYFALKMKK